MKDPKERKAPSRNLTLSEVCYSPHLTLRGCRLFHSGIEVRNSQQENANRLALGYLCHPAKIA